jgi:hypothetical protein
MVTLPARHIERPHAVGAHVAEGHWVAGWGAWSCAHAFRPATAPDPLLDHLVSGGQQRFRDGEAERLGGLLVDH